jgi:galactose mutarotase-like enzyme
VLFPSPGKLEGGKYHVGQLSGELGQHGFARLLPWTVGDMSHANGAAVTLHLQSSDATRAYWPWEFDLALTYTLLATKLRVDIRVTNNDDKPMPFAFGFHPYFRIPDDEKPGARIETRASRAFDNVQKKEVRIERISLGGREVDLHLIDHDSNRSSLSWNDDRLTIEGSSQFTRWVVWTLPGKGFVCLEPWTAPFNALNTGEGVMTVAPGESQSLFVVYSGDVKQDKVPRPPREYGT